MTRPTGPDARRAGTHPAAELAASELEARVIDLADLGWCWSRLRSTGRGVLSSHGPSVLAGVDVCYTVGVDHILIPIPWDSESLHLLAGQDVTLSLAGRTEDRHRWVVRATGLAAFAMVPASTGALAECRKSHPSRGTVPADTDTMLLAVHRIRGFHETLLDLDDVPPAVLDGSAPPAPAASSR